MDKKEYKNELNEINLEDENLTELSDEEKEKENLSKNSLLNQKRERGKNNNDEKKDNKMIIVNNNNINILNNDLCNICKKNNKIKINSYEELIDFFFDKFDCNNKENKKKLLENKNNKNENPKITICEKCLFNEILFNGFNKLFNKNELKKETINNKERNLFIEKMEKISEILEKNTNNLEAIINKMGLQLMLSKIKDKFQKFNIEVNSCIDIFKNQKNIIIQIINDLKESKNNFLNNENYTILGNNNNNNLEQNLLNKNNEHDLFFGEKNYKINNNSDNKKINFNINNINNIDSNEKTNFFISNQDSMSFSSKPTKNYIIKSLFPIHESKSNNYGTFKETQIDKINIDDINNNDKINLLSNFNIFNNKQTNDIQKQIEILNNNLKEKSSDKNEINYINDEKKNNFLNKNLEVEGIELDFSKNILKNENTDFNNNNLNNNNFSLNKNLESFLFNKNINDDNSFYNLKNLLHNENSNNYEYFNKNILFNNKELFDKMSNYNNLFLPSIINQNNLNLNFVDNNPLIPNFNNNNFLHPPSFSSENNNNNEKNLKEQLDQGINNMINEFLRAHNINQDNYPQRKNIKIEDLFTNNQSNLFPNFFE